MDEILNSIEMIMYAIVPLFLILLYLTINHLIRRYYDSKTKRLDSPTYPIILGIVSLITPVLLQFGLGNLIASFIVPLVNDFYGKKIITLQVDVVYFIIVYLVYATAIVYLLNKYIGHKFKKNIFKENDRNDENPESLEVDLYEAGITRSVFSVLTDRELAEKYLGSLHSGLAFKSEDNLIYGVDDSRLETKIVIAYLMFEDNKTKSEIKKIFDDASNLVRESHLKKKKKRFVKVESLLFVKESDMLYPMESIEVISLEDLIYDNKLYNRYLSDVKNDFDTNTVEYTQNSELSLKDIFIRPKGVINSTETKVDVIEEISKWVNDLESKDQLVITGDYGLGKTTLLKYISYSMSKRVLDGKIRSRIPIYISLANKQPFLNGIDSLVFDFHNENQILENTDLFKHKVVSGAFLFLLDGFDEIGYRKSNEDRYRNLKAIWDLSVGNNKIILTGRQSYFSEMKAEYEVLSTKKQNAFPNIYINNTKIDLSFFSEKELKSFLTKKLTSRARTDEVFNFIVSNPSLQDMCQRPYLAHITTELIDDLMSSNNSRELNAYHLINMYVEKWISRQDEKGIHSSFVSLEKKKKFIINFFELIAGEAYYFNKEYRDIDMISVRNVLSSYIDDNRDNFVKGFTLEGIETEIFSSYFITRRKHTFSFVHKSIYEFFVSRAIVKLLENKEQDAELFNKDWSNEILNLVYEAVESNLAEDETVKDSAPFLLKKISSYHDHLHSLIDASSKIYLFIRNIQYVTIIRNALILLSILFCFSMNQYISCTLVLFLGFFNAFVRDPVRDIENMQSTSEGLEAIPAIIGGVGFVFIFDFFESSEGIFKFFILCFSCIFLFVFSYSIFRIVFKHIRSLILDTNKVRSIIKCYYAQLAKEKLSASYLSRILAFLNYLDGRSFVLSNKNIDLDYCKIPFRNLRFINCTITCNRLYNSNCYFDIVKIAGDSFREIHFNNCKLHKLDLSKVEDVSMYRKYEQAFARNSGYSLEKITLTSMSLDDLDSKSIRSIKKYLKKNNLDHRFVNADDWIIEKLFA